MPTPSQMDGRDWMAGQTILKYAQTQPICVPLPSSVPAFLYLCVCFSHAHQLIPSINLLVHYNSVIKIQSINKPKEKKPFEHRRMEQNMLCT